MRTDFAFKEEIYEELDKNENGKIVRKVANVIYVLEHDSQLCGLFRKNLLTDRVDVVQPTPWNPDEHCFSDEDLNHIVLLMEYYGIINCDSMIDKAITIVAGRNKFHPIRDKLNSLEWDGTPRVEHALYHFLGSEESELVYECLKLFMLGAITRVYDPGNKFEAMLCLVGGQGVGKSTFFRFLAINDEWFSDDIKKLSDDNIVRKLQGHWIVEMAEMVATSSARFIEENKAFISRQKDTYKVPYAKYAKDFPRQCVFAGTSNKKDFLPFDRSGNRRFLPIEVGVQEPEVHIMANEAESRAYIEQMWAEIMVIYRSGAYRLVLPRHIEEELIRQRENFMPEDVDAGIIQEYLDNLKSDYVCTHQIYVEALGNTGKSDRRASLDIGDIMNNRIKGWKYGGTATRRFTNYGTQRYWSRVKDLNMDFEPLTEQMEIPFDS